MFLSTGLSCWRENYLNKATLLQDWRHRYKHSTVVITIWLTVVKYPYLIWQLIFYFLRRYFLCSITARTFTASRNCLPFASTWVHPGILVGTVFRSSLPPVVCRRTHVLFTFFVFAHSGVQHISCCVLLVWFPICSPSTGAKITPLMHFIINRVEVCPSTP